MPNLFSLLKESVYFYRANFWGIVAVLLPFVLLLAMLSWFFDGMATQDQNSISSVFSLYLVIDSALHPIYAGGLVLYLASVVTGENWRPLRCYQAALQFWLPLFVLNWLMAFMVMAGMMMFIIPGLWVMARLSFANFLCIFEGMSAPDALVHSWQRTEPYQGVLIGGVMLYFSLKLLPLLNPTAPEEADGIQTLSNMLVGTIFEILSMWFVVFCFRIYTLQRDSNQ